MGFGGGMPGAGQWHHIAVACEGGKNGLETIWVGGAPNTSETKTRNLWIGDPVRLGSTEKGHWFSGSLASVRMYDYPLNASEIGYLVNEVGDSGRPVVICRHFGMNQYSESWRPEGETSCIFSLSSLGPLFSHGDLTFVRDSRMSFTGCRYA